MSSSREKSNLSLIPLAGYDDAAAVDAALQQALEPLGGIGAFVRPGNKVLLKANLLAPASPEEAVTTHPAIVAAAIRACKKAGAAQVWVGDSPGVGSTIEVMQSCGIMQVCLQEGAQPAVFDQAEEYVCGGAAVCRTLELTHWLRQIDVLITLPKLKTHVQMGYTGALKNQFGLVPGTRKAQFHFRLQDRDRLADLMIDINRVARVRLAIMDAVMAMEGPGPHGGKPRFLGALIVSADPAAVDVVGCSLIGIPPEEYPLLQAAARAGYGATALEDVIIHGSKLNELAVSDFKLVHSRVNVMRVLPFPEWMLRWLRRQIVPTPHIDVSRCIHCMKCHNGCPVKPAAIDPKQTGRGGCVNTATCIRCYCCHEFCPVNAISLRRGWAERIFHLGAIGEGCCRALGWIHAKIKGKRR